LVGFKQTQAAVDTQSMTARRSWLLPAALALAVSACMGSPGGGEPPGSTTPTTAPATTVPPTTKPGGDGSDTGDQNGPLGNCPVMPATARPDYVGWNDDVSGIAVDANSANYISSIGVTGKLHPDFGGAGAYGIPYVTVAGSQPALPIQFGAYADQSDPGPYPVPPHAPIEGGANSTGDRHVLVVDRDNCVLYEMFNAFPGSSSWSADSGAKWNLRSNALRPRGWTSADAAGLPIFPGLVRYDEVASGHIDHALRFTVAQTQRASILPATHFASSSTDPNRPPMGLRLRLNPSFTLTCTCPQSQVILTALKKYGMIVADNGSNWFITGASDTRWDDNDLNVLKTVPGSAFTVVDTASPQGAP
jgi:hypothetical protein